MRNPSANQVHVRNIALDIVLTLLTCFLFGFYVQYRQMMAVNDMIQQQKYNFLPGLLLTIFTCGLYHIYHEFRKTQDICRALNKPDGTDPLISVLLTLFGLSIVADAIQQSEINNYYGDRSL